MKNMKELTIKICGKVNSGKNIIQYLVLKELRNRGANVEFVPDEGFGTEKELNDYCEKYFMNLETLNQFNVKVKTVQLLES